MFADLVLNKHTHGVPADAVYIGRGTMWGNRFVIGQDGDRDEVCDKHEAHLKEQIRTGEVTLQQLAGLHGRRLVCFCAPRRCHGHTLVRAAADAVAQLGLAK
jgi:hypothetical protein